MKLKEILALLEQCRPSAPFRLPEGVESVKQVLDELRDWVESGKLNVDEELLHYGRDVSHISAANHELYFVFED